MASTINNGIQGITQVCLKALNPSNPALDRVLVLPSPSAGTFNNGITETEIKSFNQIGELVLADTFVTERAGTLSLTYQAKSKEILSVFFGLALANGSKVSAVAKTIQVTANSYAAAASGFDGFGMVADQSTSIASVLSSTGISSTLTRQTFATFNAATPQSWAQGSDSAFLFSNDLVTAKSWVTIYAPYTSTSTDYLSETPQVNYAGDIVGVMINKDVYHFKFPNLVANLTENGEFEFGGGEIVLNFRIGLSGTGCQTFELLFPNRLRQC